MITGSCGLAGTVALRVGLRVRKRSGMRVLGLPPETAAVGHPAVRHPGSERDAPQQHECGIHTK
jgi:hypothetical protein